MRSVRPCIAALLLFIAILAIAEPIQNIHPTSYVTDLAGVLDSTTKQRLERLAAEVEQKTGSQLAIVTVHSLEGTTVDDYAVNLFKQLGVGKKDNRGVLILLSPDERKYRIEVGYGLEPVINDARAGDIGRSMVPSLRQQDYNGAVTWATSQVARLIAADKGVTLDGIPQPRQSNKSGGGIPWILFPIGFAIFWFIIRSISRGGRGGGRGGRGGGLLWPLIFTNFGGGWGGGSGGGGWGGSSGGFGGGSGGFGGFGGFGGGSSGGGGASGSW